jgi:ribonuclease P protein component
LTRFSFPKEARLLKSRQFHEVTKLGEKKVGKLIVIHSLNDQNSPHSTLGITVSRKYGKSNLRNRFKRIVREAFRTTRFQFTHPVALHIKPRQEAMNASSEEIQAELLALLS